MRLHLGSHSGEKTSVGKTVQMSLPSVGDGCNMLWKSSTFPFKEGGCLFLFHNSPPLKFKLVNGGCLFFLFVPTCSPLYCLFLTRSSLGWCGSTQCNYRAVCLCKESLFWNSTFWQSCYFSFFVCAWADFDILKRAFCLDINVQIPVWPGSYTTQKMGQTL